jgi:hypothetical protein
MKSVAILSIEKAFSITKWDLQGRHFEGGRKL